MTVKRLEGIPGFSIDRVAAAAGSDPDILRLETLDTDLRPPAPAIEATRLAVDDDDCTRYLPFTGQPALCEAVSDHLYKQTNHRLRSPTRATK